MKLVFLLGWKLAKYEILDKVMKEFLARGLNKVYAEEIEAWKKYMREQKFAIKLDKQMSDEVKRFQKTIKSWTPKELKEFIIEEI